MTRFVHPIWFEEAVYRRANIDIEPGNGFTSPMPLLTPNERVLVATSRAIEEWLASDDPFTSHSIGRTR